MPPKGKGQEKGEKGDRKGSGKGKKGGGGKGEKGQREDGGGKKGGKGGGKGEGSYERYDRYDRDERAGGEPQGGRSQLNSNAPDFKPSGFPYGGMYGPADMQRLWGWQPPGDQMPKMPPLWREYADEHGTPYYYNSKTGLSQWERPPELDPPKPPPPQEGSSSAEKGKGGSGEGRRDGGKGEERDEPRRGDGGYGDRDGGKGGKGGKDYGDRDSGKGEGRKGDAKGAGGKNRRGGGKPTADDGGKKKEASEFGPPGCNLFVFHLPDDWTDDDLHEYFAPHGNVVSAKVMKELGTGRSRGFGFVSYEERVGAATAIKKMQGYKILGKRLKVEFKKGEQEGGGKGEADDRGGDRSEDEEGGGSKKSYPDDERLIGYLRAISAKNVVQSLKESESARPQDDAPQESEEEGGQTGD